VCGVHGRGGERLARAQPELGRSERQHEREALAERAARVEVGGERDRGTGVDERPGRRHRPCQEERAAGEQHAGDVAGGERGDSIRTCRLEVVDRARAELDRERDRPRFGELIAVQAQREAVRARGLEVPASLVGVEGAALEEDVGRLGKRGRFREHVGEHELEIGIRVVELGRRRVRAQERRRAARVADRAQRCELSVAV
jgi:hypothetical protein